MVKAVRIEADNRMSECRDAAGHVVREGALPRAAYAIDADPQRMIEIAGAQPARHTSTSTASRVTRSMIAPEISATRERFGLGR